MKAFSFQTTKSVLSEVGSTAKVGQIFSDMDCRKVALVTDEMIRKLGLADQVLESLKAAGVDCWIFDQVIPDPPTSVVLKAVEMARGEKVEGVVSVGGGSSLDTAKLISILLNTDQKLDEMYGVNLVRGERLPLILIPTTAGTGSEVTPISIVTTETSEKKGIVAPQLLPDWAILDAELTVGLPAAVTAATGIDAMVHAIEAYTSKHKKNPVSDCLARQALELLGGNIRRVCSDPQDRDARANMLLGSMLAGMAFANAPVAAVHALAYPLGGIFHVPHGLSNALVLPYVLEFHMPEASELYLELSDTIFPELRGKTDEAKLTGLVEGFKKLGPELGMKSRLRDVGVDEASLAKMAKDAMNQTRLLVNNPREMDESQALEIYQKAF